MTNLNNLYIDLNVLQTLPPSNINRDDTGAPKTALYGGVMRARVSSQSWKQAMRKMFNQELENYGTRTLKAPKLLADQLMAVDTTLDQPAALKKASAVFNAAKVTIDKKNQTKALLLVSAGQLKKIAQYVTNHDDLKDKEVVKEIKQILKGNQSLDLALFGRMVATNPELNVEGAVQVAHAISTHEIVPEYDYYTALDDTQKESDTGATMIGSVEFNSSTLYRYANINMAELSRNLGSTDAIQGVETFIKDFLISMPTGKQHAFANRTVPSYVMVTIRPDTPVNLVSAFENPVKSRRKVGYLKESIEKLEDEYQKVQKTGFVDKPVLNVVLSTDSSKLDRKVQNLSELLEAITNALAEVSQDENTHD